MKHTSSPKFCMYVTNESILIKFSGTIAKLKIKGFVDGIFFIWSIILEHKACFQILNIISKSKICYLIKPVEFDKNVRSKCKIRKEIHFVAEIFSILYEIFSNK